MLTLLCIWSALLLGILYLLFIAFPIIFGQYGFNLQEVGITFIDIGVGMGITMATMPYWAKHYTRAVEAGGGIVESEALLPVGMVGAFLTLIGMFWLTFTSYPSVHWIAPALSTIPIGAEIGHIYISTFTYTVSTRRSYQEQFWKHGGVFSTAFSSSSRTYSRQSASGWNKHSIADRPWCPKAVRDDTLHIYVECPRTREVWQEGWKMLRLFWKPAGDWGEPTHREILLAFPGGDNDTSDTGRFRLCTWYVLMLVHLRSAFVVLSRATIRSSFRRVPPDSRLDRIPRLVAREIFGLALGQFTGPDQLTSSTFWKLWLEDNSLFAVKVGIISLTDTNKTNLTTVSQDEDDNSDSQTDSPATLVQPHPTAPQNALPTTDNAHSSPPSVTPKWAQGRKICSCCLRKTTIEVATRFCVICWIARFPTIPTGRRMRMHTELDFNDPHMPVPATTSREGTNLEHQYERGPTTGLLSLLSQENDR